MRLELGPTGRRPEASVILPRPMRGLLVAVVLIVAGCSGGVTTTTSSRAPQSSDPRALVLTPGDLARGYEYGDDTVCARADASEGDLRTLQTLFAEEAPKACIMELQWVWKGEPPYSRGVTSAAYVFRNVHAAGRLFADRDELAAYTASLRVRERQRLELGDEAEMLQGTGLNYPAAGVVWRTGKVVGVLVAEPERNDVARELAKKQQARFEHQRPPAPTEGRNDPALQLDDPTLTLPVYWLGRSFDPGRPAGARVRACERRRCGPRPSGPALVRRPGQPGDRLVRHLHAGDVEPIQPHPPGAADLGPACAQSEVVRVRGGRALIYHGYGAPKPVERPCPRRPPDRVVAHVRYARVIVAVDMPYCYACAAPAGRSPFDTVPGMEALVRALRLRAPRR